MSFLSDATRRDPCQGAGPALGHWSALLAALLLGGCGEEMLGGACLLGAEHRIAVPVGPLVHDVALATEGRSVWALWSDRSGAFVRAIDPDGRPREHPIRIGPACDGGMAALAQSGALLVACGRRGDEARGDDGGVQLFEVREGRVRVRGALGAMGRDGQGVALAVAADGALHVGWQQARGAVSSAWIARALTGAEPERISHPRHRASRPALALRDGTLLVAWAETWLRPDGEIEGRVRLRSGPRTRDVAALAFEHALPVLRPGVGHDLALSFRDRRPAGSRPRVQVARVRPGPLRLDRIEAAAHANAAGEAFACGCGSDIFVVAPRTHSRTERLVSIRRHGPDLRPRGPEQQVYEHGAVFEHADAACVDGRLLVLFAGRPGLDARQGSVRATTVSCAGPPS